MRRAVANTYELVAGAVRGFVAHDATRKAAALSFYTLFSLAPLVTVVLAVVALVADASTARAAFAEQLGALVGPASARAILAVADASARDSGGTLASMLALGATFVGATTVFAELKNSLDEIWSVPAAPRKAVWEMIRARLLSFGLLLTIGFLLLVSLFVSTALASLASRLDPWLGGLVRLAEVLNTLAALAAVTVLFAAIFKWLPDARLAWRDTWLGASVTAALFTIGKVLIGVYLGVSAFSSAFGAAGSLVVVVVWVYYSAWILFLGVEITREFAQRHGTLRGTRPAGDQPALRRPNEPA